MSYSRYRTIHCMIWNDDKFPYLSDYGKLVFFHILTTPLSTPFGCFKAGKAALLEESRMDPKGFSKGFKECLSKDRIRYDERTLTVLLPKFLNHNKPSNPNVVKKWGKVFTEVPESVLKAEAFVAIRGCCEELGEPFMKAFNEGFWRPSVNGMANQEQEQEQEQENNILSSSTTARPHIPYQKIIAHLNEKANRDFKATTAATKAKIKARFNDGFSEDDFYTVIENRVKTWGADQNMVQYLRPETLFGPKFESYLQAANVGGNRCDNCRYKVVEKLNCWKERKECNSYQPVK